MGVQTPAQLGYGGAHEEHRHPERSQAVSGAAALFALGAIIAVYFGPSFVAWGRGVPNLGSIVVVNAFLGWTLIGWVVALAMAARSIPRDQIPAS
jgi:hypothetical protein